MASDKFYKIHFVNLAMLKWKKKTEGQTLAAPQLRAAAACTITANQIAAGRSLVATAAAGLRGEARRESQLARERQYRG